MNTLETAPPRPADAYPPPSRRIALIAIVAGVTVVVATAIAVVLGWRLIGRAADTAEGTLDISSSLVQTVDDTIAVADLAVDQAADGLATIQHAMEGTDRTLRTASEVMTDTAELVSTDIPSGLDSVRETMPALIQSAQLIDNALGALSFAGIDFSPQTPPQDSLAEVDAGLAQVADKLRSASGGLAQIGADFDAVGADVGAITSDLTGVVATLEEADALLDDYRATASGAVELVEESRASLRQQTTDARMLLLLLAAAVALGQLVPIAAGVSLLGRPYIGRPQSGVPTAQTVDV